SRLGGLVHLQFPESRRDPPGALHQPSLYADTGIPHILQEALRQGAAKDRLLITIAGGAQTDDALAPGNGKQNYLAVRKVLWKLGVLLQGESVGGKAIRNVRLEVATGKSWLPE